MNKNYLEIDLSRSNEENDDKDLMRIQLKSGNTVQFNFSRFFFSSKYLLDKYSEMMKSIEREIIEVENKYKIKEEIIKEFIEIITKNKVIIPIEHYKDIYTLSKHFCIQKLTTLLDNMMENLIDTHLNFFIQILVDDQDQETGISSKIENIIKTRVNECLKSDKFKEVPIPTIYRIIDSAMSSDRERVDVNNLLDFIIESASTRFTLFKFVELHRLSKDKLKEFIKFIDSQEEKSQQTYFEYIPFNFLFVKRMKQENEELSNRFKHIEVELKLTKEELRRMKQENKELTNRFERSEEKLKQSQEEIKQIIEKSNKQYTHTMMVGGSDRYNLLGQKPNKDHYSIPYIHPSQKSSIDPSSLLSFSIYWNHSVQVTRSGKLLGIGDNRYGHISDSLPKTEITEFTEFSIRDVNGHQLDPISAVCTQYGTLYMFSSGSRRQLVLCDSEINGGHPVFLV